LDCHRNDNNKKYLYLGLMIYTPYISGTGEKNSLLLFPISLSLMHWRFGIVLISLDLVKGKWMDFTSCVTKHLWLLQHIFHSCSWNRKTCSCIYLYKIMYQLMLSFWYIYF